LSEHQRQKIDVDALELSATIRTVAVGELDTWLVAAASSFPHSVRLRSLEELENWSQSSVSGDIAHKSGRFFTVTGARYSGNLTYTQPIIHQPDVGILGLVGKIVDGVALFLIQAKVEPGNRRLAQLSPTVQATSSNFERVHGGRPTPYLSVFQSEPQSPSSPAAAHSLRRLFDIEQSEQSTRFLGKRNRNAVVFADSLSDDIDPTKFRWLTLGDLYASLLGDDMLHMDTRSVLGSLGAFFVPRWVSLDFQEGAARAAVRRHTTKGWPRASAAEVERWLDTARDSHEERTIRIPLRDVAGWDFVAGEFRSRDEEDGTPSFDIVGVRTEAGSREVTSWDQPLLRNHPGRDSVLVVQFRSGVLHVLLSVSRGSGPAPGIEIGPTLLREAKAMHVTDSAAETVRSIELALESGRTLLDVGLPEEGGRFLHSQTRHRIIALSEEVDVNPAHPFCWVDFEQLQTLLATPRLCSIELRSLLSCCSPELDWRG
jgi:dTDP-4-dehydro-6-deoxy-alpha-D-glucopyranose 2,3-dehydratase